MEKDILYTALENFYQTSNLSLDIHSLSENSIDNDYDGTLRLKNECNSVDFLFEVKQRLTLSKIHKTQKYFNRKRTKNVILISDYIPNSMKEYLRNMQLSYLDSAGNAFITNKRDLFIYVETNKNLPLAYKKSNRAFNKSGLKVVYQILIDERVLNKPYRYIGYISKVSIDTVRRVIKELLRDKYIIQLTKKKYKVISKERLLQEWVTVFNKVLRPKLKQQKFTSLNPNLDHLLKKQVSYSIGGELAAEYLSNFLIGENAILYTESSFIDLAKKLDLRPSQKGKITLCEKFWMESDDDTKNIHSMNQKPYKFVHPILLYADLLDNPTSRNLSTAKIIYNTYVKTIL
ncbi:type IV toxin-antitoxin system AbiEi family antitoxin [Aureispira anguillae]|uniref:Type IV toxin-antitoxin system AbiEi family antitoxin n=1 Tax=Aureispira anguillae TaxID=2864201 RepID=A0A916DWS4_9BACT|nr:type IV toxin-antitoxin system AbiEi family antitoxin [Aureispira anguillae]BDS15010.1 type IV toxin-antitoxin system AbiEi family antitoxin [Aureispira anguillae]